MSRPRPGVGIALGLAALVALSLVLRTTRMGTGFWIDEGLAVGIADHPVGELPGLLRQDGSPPLYYVLLHGWMAVLGRSEEATHALSLLLATATVPAALWAGRSIGGPRCGWILAGLAAVNPFLTIYAQETRMYALVVLLGTLTTAWFAHAFLLGRRRALVPFALGLAALLYTHNWAFFYAAGLVLALLVAGRTAPDRRGLARDAALGLGLAAALYLPWLPTFADQALHTGAPWAEPPGLATLLRAPGRLLGGWPGVVLVVLGTGAGLLALGRGRPPGRHPALVPALLVLALVPVPLAWAVSQLDPAWATRYLAMALAPGLLVIALGLARAGRIGLVVLALVGVVWVLDTPPASKSNAKEVARDLGGALRPGEVVVSAQPEQVPVLSYYAPPGLRWATPLGPVRDLGVVDWRDGAERFDRARGDRPLRALVARMRPGQRMLLVVPIIARPERWGAPWTSRVRARGAEYERLLRADERLELLRVVPVSEDDPGPNPLQGLLFARRGPGMGSGPGG